MNNYKYKDLSFKIGECSIPISCNNKHKTHKNISYENIIPDIDKIKEDKKKLRKLIINQMIVEIKYQAKKKKMLII